MLVNKAEQPLTEPTIIYGHAGTGKTITILARIQGISGNLNPSCKAIYVSFQDNAIAMARGKLEACGVDLANITFININSLSGGNLNSIICCEEYRYIYLDSVEDLGVDWVNRLLEFVLSSRVLESRKQGLSGDFWITMDPYQGLRDTHSLVRGLQNQINWQGNLIDSNLLEKGFSQKRFVNLTKCFRMPLKMINHLEREKILPIKDLPKAQEVNSLGVVVINDITLPATYTIQWLAQQLAERLKRTVMRRGIHPGHCSVLYDHMVEEALFPSDQGGLPAFLQTVNESLQGLAVEKQASHVLQLTQSIQETLLYGSRNKSKDTSAAATPVTVQKNVAGVLLDSSDPEETKGDETERHSEVILK